MAMMPNAPQSNLGREAFDNQGAPITTSDEATLVTAAKREAQAFLQSKQWTLMWRDADILDQSPRPLSIWENTYVNEPNVTRFTVLTQRNSIGSQMKKGIFYEDPPMVLRPRGGTSKETTDWKREVMTYLLRDMNFEGEIDHGIEQFTLLGSTVFKRTVVRKKICVTRRMATAKSVPAGAGQQQSIPTDEPPKLEQKWVVQTRVKFEMLDIAGDVMEGLGGEVYVDPKLASPNIQDSPWVVHRGYVDYYDLLELALDPVYEELLADWETKTRPAKNDKGEDIEEEYETVKLDEDGKVVLNKQVLDWFFPPAETADTPAVSDAQGNIVHHAESPTANTSNPLNKKLEILEYLNQKTGHVITVLNETLVIRSGDSKGEIKYYSANFFNRRRAFYGIGVGLIAGQDQRVQQGGLNSALKLLSMILNSGYWAEQASLPNNQMIRTGIGKIHTIADITKAPKLIETGKVDPAVWAVIQNSKQESESATGADATLVGGSTVGPRSSILRTSKGASLAAGASSTRLDGPLGHLIDQVIVPFFYDLDDIIKRFISDAELLFILGERLGQTAIKDLDLQQFHDGKHEYDVLAGAKLAAKATMAQSLVIISQYVFNPQFQQFMAERGKYLDEMVFFRMLMQSSEWGQGVEEELIKDMTPEMKQAYQQRQQQGSKLAGQMALQNQKYQLESGLQDQKTQNRAMEKIAVDSVRAAGEQEAVTGEPTGGGFGSPQEGVVE